MVKCNESPLEVLKSTASDMKLVLSPVSNDHLTKGDWVTLTNPNDSEKPIIAQIFKTWQTLGYSLSQHISHQVVNNGSMDVGITVQNKPSTAPPEFSMKMKSSNQDNIETIQRPK